MLVLSRRANEKILIGDDITIHIVRIGPNTVKVGIDCPKEIIISRAELRNPNAPPVDPTPASDLPAQPAT